MLFLCRYYYFVHSTIWGRAFYEKLL